MNGPDRPSSTPQATPAPTPAERTHPRSAPKLSRRRLLKLGGALAAGSALAACTAPWASPPPSPASRVQLVYQDWRTDWFPPMARQMLEEFHDEHPSIRVFYVPDAEILEPKIMADMQAGTAPDVFQGCCSWFPILAQRNYTLDLRPYVASDLDRETIADWDHAQYRALFAPDGRQYGLPKYHGALGLYYNKDLFDQHGVAYPTASWDHDDYLAAMKALTCDRDGDGETDLWGSLIDVSWERVQMHVNGWGGHFVDPADPTVSRMCEPPAMAALEWLRARIWDDRVMASPLSVQNLGTRQAFVTKRVAMVEDGSWALRDILAGADFRVGVAPFPAGPVGKVTLATTDGFGIYAGTKHPEAAWELMKFLISKEYGRAMARAQFLQPARASLVNDWVDFVRQEFPEKAKDVDIAAFADGHIKGYSATGEVFANMSDATRLAHAAWDQILTLGREPVSAMTGACRQIQEAQRRPG